MGSWAGQQQTNTSKNEVCETFCWPLQFLRGRSFLLVGLSVINLTYLTKGKHSPQDEVNRFDTRSHLSGMSLTIASCLIGRGSMLFAGHLFV